MTFILVALGAAVAVAVELLEALAIVLAVGVSRGWRDAGVGAAGGVLACALLAVLLGPVLLANVDIDVLRAIIGALLLYYGLKWLRKNTLRLAGRKARASSQAEYEETLEAAERTTTDWAARAVAFKGVLLEGIEIVLIVGALAARPSGATAALVGACVAAVLVIAAGVALRRPLSRIPETELKWGVGALLTAFGLFFLGEGLHVHWPGGDAAVVYILAALIAADLLVLLRIRA
jgi:uncharacterized membrane protein